jgi:hypothetical protein
MSLSGYDFGVFGRWRGVNSHQPVLAVRDSWHHPRMNRTPHRLRTCLALLVAVVLLAVFSNLARASSTLEIIGATTGGNQITARVLSHGSAATYFNPSLLPEATPKIEVGFFGLATQSNIRLKARPAGVDVPTSVYNTVVPGGPNVIRPLATADLPNLRSDTDADNNAIYAAIGMVRPLAGKALVFGFYAFLPVRAFLDQNGFFADEREQYFSDKLHFELLGDRLDVSTFTFALGSQLNEWLSIGAGIDVAILTQSKVAVYVPDGSDQSRVLLAPNINTDSKFKPYFAATVHPTQRSSVIATLHLAFANNTNGENDLRFWNYTYPSGQNSVQQTYTISQGSEPLRFAIGGSYSGPLRANGRAPWELGVQLLGERWSQYYNRQGEHPLDTWNNTVSVALGGGFLWRERHVTADIGYSPSPVPDQTGRTNYVDNSRLLASAGIEGQVRFLGKELEAGITLFGSLFIPRETTKDPNAAHPVVDEFPSTATDIKTGLPSAGTAGLQTNNPGYPGWKSTGYMLGAGATFRISR